MRKNGSWTKTRRLGSESPANQRGLYKKYTSPNRKLLVVPLDLTIAEKRLDLQLFSFLETQQCNWLAAEFSTMFC